MGKKNQVCLTVLTIILICSTSQAVIYYDDGGTHTISTGSNEIVVLDYNTANDPGTHLELVDPGYLGNILTYNNSTALISGGNVFGTITLYDASVVTRSGGYFFGATGVADHAKIIITGGMNFGSGVTAQDFGSIDFSEGKTQFIHAYGNATITTSGGEFSTLEIYENATVNLIGDNLRVVDLNWNMTILSPGDNLSTLGTFVQEYGQQGRYEGTIVRTLQDGTVLDTAFRIYNTGEFEGTAEITVIPEPATLLLLGIGGLMLRKKRPFLALS